MNPIIANEAINVKNDSRNSIIRVVHNRENPFVQLNKNALWDPNLSLKAVGLWARCMSRPNDWKFSIKELVTKCKEGRQSIDSAMQELIDSNYVCRFRYSEKNNGKFASGGVEYVFFEFPATEEEKLEQLEIFKKCYRHSGFRDHGNRDHGNPHLLIKSSKEKEDTYRNKEHIYTPPPDLPTPLVSACADDACFDQPKSPKKKITRDFSAQVKEVSQKMISILMANNPVYRPPSDLDKFYYQVQQMIEVDNQPIDLVIRTFEWAAKDTEKRGTFAGWQGIIATNKKGGKSTNPAEVFRGHFPKIHAQMISRPERKFSPSSNDAEGLRLLDEMLKDSL